MFLALAVWGCGAVDAGGPVGCDEVAVEASPVGGAENVLIVVIDDVGVDKVSTWGLHPAAPDTPRLDTIAAQGLRFNRAYAEPTCSPTRAALLTGRHPSRTGIGRWLDLRGDDWPLPDDERTLPEALSSASDPWSTAAVGKWHLSVARPGAANDPNRQGFDTFRGILGNPNMALGWDGRVRGYGHWERIVDGEATWEDRWLTTVQTDDAISLMGTLAEPWLIYVGYSAAHTPWEVPPGVVGVGREPVDRYDAVVRHLDGEIGRLWDAIPDPSGTTVFIVGDNGTPGDVVRPPWALEAAKATVTEGGVRVPWIVTGPRVMRPGTATEALVHVVDVYATVLDIAGVAVERRDPQRRVDGRTLLPVLGGEEGDRVCVMVEHFDEFGDPASGDRERSVIGRDRKLGSTGVVTEVGPDPSTEREVDGAAPRPLREAMRAYQRAFGW